MQVGPPTRRATLRPWALIALAGTRGLIVTTAEGTVVRHRALQVHQALAGLAGHVVYVNTRLTECRRIGGDARAWQASMWRGATVSMEHTPTGTVVRSLRGTLEHDPDPADSLEAFRTWLESFGVGLAGISGMARNLWRRTLPTTYIVEADHELARGALFGGRQGIRSARTFRHQVLLDLEAAYPFEQANRPYALTLRKVSPQTTLDPDQAGLVTAAVHVPAGIPYGLLPERFPGDATVIGYRRATTVTGTWSWREVCSAVACGAELVRIHECHAPATEADLYGTWWATVASGRQLPRGAGRLVKACTNALWGTHAVRGESFVGRWDTADGNGAAIITRGRQIPNPYRDTIHLATETTARVRSRLLVDVLADEHIAPPVHVDTDGVILRRRADVAHLLGEGPGTWRIKRKMPTVDIRAPQVYRFQCGPLCGVDHAPWHYSVSGVPASLAPQVFEQASARASTMVALPPGWEDSRGDLVTDDVWS